MTECRAIAPPVPTKAPSHPRGILRRLWRGTITLLAVIGFISVVRPFLFEITPMASGSMSPTLQGDSNGGDWVLAEKLTYRFRSPRRWEVVEFHDSEGIQIMKRVAGMPGESVAVKENRLLVNGQNLDPPAGTPRPTYYPYGNLSGGKAHDVGNGYYVLGDDSADSDDSRYEGSVSADHIEARALFIIWPPSRMGWVR